MADTPNERTGRTQRAADANLPAPRDAPAAKSSESTTSSKAKGKLSQELNLQGSPEGGLSGKHRAERAAHRAETAAENPDLAKYDKLVDAADGISKKLVDAKSGGAQGGAASKAGGAGAPGSPTPSAAPNPGDAAAQKPAGEARPDASKVPGADGAGTESAGGAEAGSEGGPDAGDGGKGKPKSPQDMASGVMGKVDGAANTLIDKGVDMADAPMKRAARHTKAGAAMADDFSNIKKGAAAGVYDAAKQGNVDPWSLGAGAIRGAAVALLRSNSARWVVGHGRELLAVGVASHLLFFTALILVFAMVGGMISSSAPVLGIVDNAQKAAGTAVDSAKTVTGMPGKAISKAQEYTNGVGGDIEWTVALAVNKAYGLTQDAKADEGEKKQKDDAGKGGHPENAWGGYSNGRIPKDKICEIKDVKKAESGRVYSLRCDASTALTKMAAAYKKDTGKDIIVNSAYRDYAYQKKLYDENLAQNGGKPNGMVGKPGGSNHGWGLAVDMNMTDGGGRSFSSTLYTWLTKNAATYGFKHPDWAQEGSSTPEAWHWEYSKKWDGKSSGDASSDDTGSDTDTPAATNYDLDKAKAKKMGLPEDEMGNVDYVGKWAMQQVANTVAAEGKKDGLSANLNYGVAYNNTGADTVADNSKSGVATVKSIYIDAIKKLPFKDIDSKADQIYTDAHNWWLGTECGQGSGDTTDTYGSGNFTGKGVPKRAIPWIENAAKHSKYHIPPAFFAYIMDRESDFTSKGAYTPDSNGGTWGLFQINQEEWRTVTGGSGIHSPKDIEDPMVHTTYGAKYFDNRLETVRRIRKNHPNAPYTKDLTDLEALMIAHNAGEGNLMKYPNLPSITRSYLAEFRQKFKGYGGGEPSKTASKAGSGDSSFTPADSSGSTANNTSADDSAGDTSSSTGDKLVKPQGKHPKTSDRKERWGKFHAGTDYGMPVGTPLPAMFDGTVTFSGSMNGYGNYIIVKGTWKGKTLGYAYAHMSKRKVKVGDKVKAGQIIALSGNQGKGTGPHLHLELRTKDFTGPGRKWNTEDADKFLKSNGAVIGDNSAQPSDDNDAQQQSCKASNTGDGDGSGTVEGSTAEGAAIVKAAEKYLKTPYVWGGGDFSGPTSGGFDCSGLVLYSVYQGTNKRVKLSHSSDSMRQGDGGKLKKIKKSDLRPGDIVTMSHGPANSTAHHVVIYYGKGKVIDAPKTGDVVKIQPLSDWAGQGMNYLRVPAK